MLAYREKQCKRTTTVATAPMNGFWNGMIETLNIETDRKWPFASFLHRMPNEHTNIQKLQASC